MFMVFITVVHIIQIFIFCIFQIQLSLNIFVCSIKTEIFSQLKSILESIEIGRSSYLKQDPQKLIHFPLCNRRFWIPHIRSYLVKRLHPNLHMGNRIMYSIPVYLQAIGQHWHVKRRTKVITRRKENSK